MNRESSQTLDKLERELEHTTDKNKILQLLKAIDDQEKIEGFNPTSNYFYTDEKEM